MGKKEDRGDKIGHTHGIIDGAKRIVKDLPSEDFDRLLEETTKMVKELYVFASDAYDKVYGSPDEDMVYKEIRIGPALWRQGVGDIPVKVIKKLGNNNGKDYYLVEGISPEFSGFTGVPADELVQEDES